MSGIGPTDFVQMFSVLFGDVTAVRSSRGLPPLVSVHLGKEHELLEESPPRIVVIPTRIGFQPSRKMGAQPMTGGVAAFNPRPFSARASSSKPTFGATSPSRRRVRPSSKTSGTPSTARSSSCESFSGRSCETRATTRPSSTDSPQSGVSRRIRCDSGACSCSRSRWSSRSQTSRGRCSSRRPSPSTRSLCPPLARQPMAARSSSHHERA